MEDAIYSYFTDTAKTHVVVIIIEVVALLVAMGIDFFTGMYKARVNGEKITSRKKKMTAQKANRYFSPFAVLVFMDLIAAVYLPAPLFSIPYAIYLLSCEFTSIREKAWEKAEIERASRTINMVLENREDLAKAIAEILNNPPSPPKSTETDEPQT